MAYGQGDDIKEYLAEIAELKERLATKLNYDHGNPAVAHVLQFFRFEHLPEHLQEVRRGFAVLAMGVAWWGPSNPETTVALRKLLEAKDAAVRSALISGRD